MYRRILIVTAIFSALLSTQAVAQSTQIAPYSAPAVKPYTAPTVKPYRAPTVQSYREPAAKPDTRPGQKTAFNDGIYLTNNGCIKLHCDAEPGMIGVIEQFQGAAPQYARRQLTLIVVNTKNNQKEIENRHVAVFSNGKFDGNVTGYDKPSGKYAFLLYPANQVDKAHLIGGGIFTVIHAKKPDPLAPVAMDVTGTWYGLGNGSFGTIKFNADGSYERDGTRGGHYVASDGHVHFDGALAAWNNGDAVTTANGALVFYWVQNGMGVEMSFAKQR